MKTLKRKITENIIKEKEVEFNLPCFRKDGSLFYRIGEDERCLEVQLWKHTVPVIQYRDSDVPFYDGTTDSNESEFNEAFEEAINRLKKLQ